MIIYLSPLFCLLFCVLYFTIKKVYTVVIKSVSFELGLPQFISVPICWSSWASYLILLSLNFVNSKKELIVSTLMVIQFSEIQWGFNTMVPAKCLESNWHVVSDQSLSLGYNNKDRNENRISSCFKFRFLDLVKFYPDILVTVLGNRQ